VEPDGFYRMTPFEIATGWVAGMDPPEADQEPPHRHPLDVLKDVIRPPLETGRCVVTFSGGRDSSAILAVAVEVAREEGLPLPIPVTQVFASAPETDETEWQELALRHLRITEWERLVYDEGEADLIGPAATESLRQIGLVWPPALHTKERVWKAGSGGFLLTGEGGDEIFGIRRVTPITRLLRRQVGSRRRTLRKAARAVTPRPVRRRSTTSEIRQTTPIPWLTPNAEAAFRDLLVSDALVEPLPWRSSIISLLQRRGVTKAHDNLAAAGAAFNTTVVDPLLDPGFVYALAEFGGRLGFSGRSDATRALFGHLLPEALITREEKVYFNTVLFSESSKRFAASWDGEGVDTSLVVPDQLKVVWESHMPHAASASSLQAAWLNASQDAPP
jgi:asparagine synthase (glutamine-hydrolysing)